MSTFTIGERDFLLDGQPFRILSGALHYFRVHPEQWEDRILAAKEMGLNTIETYVAWNEHEPERGSFRSDGALDLGRFLDLVAEAGMHAIVRPGPFICAEWDNGGLPGWLTRECGSRIRCSDPRYLRAVGEYFARVLPIVVPRQVDRGGPVILLQVENEYGAYGADKEYLATLVSWMRAGGITVPLTTVDQPEDRMLEDGRIDGAHLTASFGSNGIERLGRLRRHQPDGPLMCAEFWDGWFDRWGGRHNTTDATAAARELEEILSTGASVNIYMFHGGTNFGLTNGANHKGYYEPTTTSYDYDAPLSEDGVATAKYRAFRAVLGRYVPLPERTRRDPGEAPAFSSPFDAASRLLSVVPLATGGDHLSAPSMDELGAYRGLVLYRAEAAAGVLRVGEVRDRAQVFADGRPVGVLEREHNDVAIELPDGTRLLEILVEDQGRVNYGPRIGEPKGLIGPVTLNGRELRGWSVDPIDLDHPDRYLEAGPDHRTGVGGPIVARSTFRLDEPADLHLATRDLGKGFAWVNGWPLGRFWSRGPQHSLYVPGPATRAGENQLVVLALGGALPSRVTWLARPDRGPLEA
ncbi:glycoside hydrolase family 35 protein [Leifsonia aquatica]|uniref:Beta-galactosidase n=2 Tax=Leifsonia aquatica TaxID=144185 RepID=A0A7W4UXF2_LEIAQ|nr:beta-galactosidase family protein [Leifsonia aquatica]MBB2968029.1 beta-galactosidase [Leifsonia aquatica]